LSKILFFSWTQLAIVVAVGLATGILGDYAETLQFTTVARFGSVMSFNYYIAHLTGGPLFGDLLETWLEAGAVIAACLVRRPGAGTIALTVNGFCQVFVHSTHDPHLLYGVPGLGADLVFALFRYRRYDLGAVSLAGIACAVFWYPVVWFTHGLYLYPVSFILPDLAVRVAGSAVGDGMFGAALALAVLALSGRSWGRPFASAHETPADSGHVKAIGISLAVAGATVVALTYALPSVSSFFVSIGPAIPSGIPTAEEYNPGYAIGAALFFLVFAIFVFWSLRSRELGERQD
jgi:ABC-type thiamin/hydroxymethylpyrimidine transport system permease subunit